MVARMLVLLMLMYAIRYGVPEIIADVTNKFIATLQLYKNSSLYCKTFARMWAHDDLHMKKEISLHPNSCDV